MNNFEPDTGLHWYRKLDFPVDAGSASKAVEFSRLIAAELGIKNPVIYWFDKADLEYAGSGWSAATDKQPSPCSDPAPHTCPFFRIFERAETVHLGFTPFHADGHFFIQIGFPVQITLKAVADECFHLYQDFRNGSDWRKQDENYALAEEEAAQFAESKAKLIADFLDGARLD